MSSLIVPKADYWKPEYKNFKYATVSNMIVWSDSIDKIYINSSSFELITKTGAYIFITSLQDESFYQIQWYENKEDYEHDDPVFLNYQVESNKIFNFIDSVKIS